jgi:hypothetical protein
MDWYSFRFIQLRHYRARMGNNLASRESQYWEAMQMPAVEGTLTACIRAVGVSFKVLEVLLQ